MLVYSNGDWTVRFTRPVKWASLNKLQGYGNNEIVFTYSANYGISRKIGVVFEKGSLTDTVMFSQAGAITDASLSFSKPAVTLLKSRSQIFTPISTNLRYCIDDLEASVTYYDNDGLPNDPVTVLTRAEEGEALRTLDGNDHALTPGMLVIADPEGPVALAGVKGGANSANTDETPTIVIESANFLGHSIRKTAIALGMRTDASGRFE